MTQRGLEQEVLDEVLRSISQFASRQISLKWRLAQDDKEEFPAEIVAKLMSEVGLHLVYIPEECGGLGAGAFDVARVSEVMASVDLGLATAFFAISLGLDPIAVGATPEQKRHWMQRVADEMMVVAYGVTEPSAGSDLGALKARAVKVERDGKTYYRLSGNKQFITNGGVADLYTILANTDAGPCFFIVEKGTKGLIPGKAEDKHGIRMSNTAALTLDEVEVPAENLIGGVEGRGLAQAQQVFGYTRLMVAAFGLGGGVAALERAVAYARERRQGGSLLSEKQAFTHKLLVPHAVRLAAARAYIEDVARRLDSGEEDLQCEGAVAKLCATEAGNAAADAAVQALGGYGYVREYEVEKIRRDVRITTIYEGTSEIQQWTIARERWRTHLQTQGGFYAGLADGMRRLHAANPEVGAGVAALALDSLRALFDRARERRLTRHQHVLFRLGELCMQAETAAAFCQAAAGAARGPRPPAPVHKAMARIYAREASAFVAGEGVKWLRGCDPTEDIAAIEKTLKTTEINAAFAGLMADLDTVAHHLCGAESAG